jgi:hypothetical protein
VDVIHRNGLVVLDAFLSSIHVVETIGNHTADAAVAGHSPFSFSFSLVSGAVQIGKEQKQDV